MLENELYHWGIKGQKWGIRRFQNENGTLTSAGKDRYRQSNRSGYDPSNSQKEYVSHSPQRISASSMSDEELRRVINRLDMERRYDSFYANDNKTNIKTGTEKIKNFLDISTKSVALVTATVAAATAIKNYKNIGNKKA